METSYIDLIMRLSLALVLGGAIGLEREYRAKEAGFRTIFLWRWAVRCSASCRSSDSAST